jgi:hypothetical protein
MSDVVDNQNSGPEASDTEPVLADYATALADGLDATLATWVVRCVTGLMTAWSGSVDPDVVVAAEEAGARCREEIGGEIRRLLAADIDQQRGTPLAVLRRAVSYPTAVLVAAGVPPLERDSFAEQVFPDDLYDLSPASFADIDPSLTDAGLAWGAAKAFEPTRRHRPA